MAYKSVLSALFLFFCFYAHGLTHATADSLKGRSTNATDSAQANLLNKIAAEYLYTQGDSAFVYARQARKLSAILNYERGQATALLTIASALSYNELYRASIDTCRQAMILFSNLRDSLNICRCYIRLGSNFVNLNNYREALACYHTLAGIAERNHYLSEAAKAYHGMGNVLMYSGKNEYARALEYNRKAFDNFSKSKDIHGMAICSATIGWIFISKEKGDSALHYYQKAIELFIQDHDSVNIASAYLNMGNADTTLGRYDDALNHYFASVRITEEKHLETALADAYSNIGFAYLHLKKYPEAIEFTNKAIAISEKHNYTHGLINSYEQLSSLYDETGDFRNAYKFYRLFKIQMDTLLQRQQADIITEMEAKYQDEKKRKEIESLIQQASLQNLQLSRKNYVIYTLISLSVMITLLILLWNRQRKAEEQYKRSALEQRLLRSQMNPHFIFNSLMAIQNYLLRNDSEKAIEVLAKYAKLTRNILESSRLEVIPLEKEIQLLEYYLDLQKLRFEKTFSYSIHTDPELDKESVLIPPMLTQPFIENAIEHGLLQNENQSNLSIRFLKKTDDLVVEIEDNGIGFRAIKDSDKKSHLSLATLITKERLDLINKKKKKKANLLVTDVKNTEGTREGTKIIFVIPLQTL